MQALKQQKSFVLTGCECQEAGQCHCEEWRYEYAPDTDNHADEAPTYGLGVQIPIADGGHRDYSDPHGVPIGVELQASRSRQVYRPLKHLQSVSCGEGSENEHGSDEGVGRFLDDGLDGEEGRGFAAVHLAHTLGAWVIEPREVDESPHEEKQLNERKHSEELVQSLICSLFSHGLIYRIT